MQDGSNVLRIGHTVDPLMANYLMLLCLTMVRQACHLMQLMRKNFILTDMFMITTITQEHPILLLAWKLDGNGNDSHTGGSHDGTVTDRQMQQTLDCIILKIKTLHLDFCKTNKQSCQQVFFQTLDGSLRVLL